MAAEQRRPTLLNSCAMAATAAEARFRIDDPVPLERDSRVVALDDGAADIVARISEREWSGAHFFTYEDTVPMAGPEGPLEDATLRGPEGSRARLSNELDEADVVVMIATANGSAEAAAVIGQACAARLITPAGLILDRGEGVDNAISALRPYAMVLAILKDEGDIPALLTALRA